MAIKPEAVLIQKPLDTGLSKREIKEIMEILKPDFRTEMDLLSITGESAAALGFIDMNVEDEKLNVDVSENSPFYKGIQEILNDRAKETPDGVYTVAGINVIMRYDLYDPA